MTVHPAAGVSVTTLEPLLAGQRNSVLGVAAGAVLSPQERQLDEPLVGAVEGDGSLECCTRWAGRGAVAWA